MFCLIFLKKMTISICFSEKFNIFWQLFLHIAPPPQYEVSALEENLKEAEKREMKDAGGKEINNSSHENSDHDKQSDNEENNNEEQFSSSKL